MNSTISLRLSALAHFILVAMVAMTMSMGMSPAARAAAPAGTVAYTSGIVSIEPASGAKRFAVAGSDIESGDTVATSRGAEAVLLMADHARIYLKADSRFRIDDYRFGEDDPKQNVSVSSLLRGGLRVISGLIGKQGNPDAYKLKTLTATIGIRGTEWSVLECGQSGVGSASSMSAGPSEQPIAPSFDCPAGKVGEHIRVYHGTIDVRTEVDDRLLSEGFGTIIRSPHSSFAIMPGAQVEPVVPSPAACK